jgi:hypothetical protein
MTLLYQLRRRLGTYVNARLTDVNGCDAIGHWPLAPSQVLILLLSN